MRETISRAAPLRLPGEATVAQPSTMRIFEHLEELRGRLKWSFLTVFFLFIFFVTFQARVADVGGVSVPYPYPDPLRPFASQFFNLTLTFLKPDFVEAVVLSPAESWIVQMKTAVFLAVLVGLPMVSYQMASFIAPALYERERRAILVLVVPSLLLFAAGVALAMFVVLPITFSFLYSIASGLGAQRLFLPLEEFLNFTLIFTLGFGLAFELPVVMYALSATGIVRAATWKKYWRFAVIGIFVFGAMITPDGSGVTMMLVSLPMLGLYLAGYVAALAHERNVRK